MHDLIDINYPELANTEKQKIDQSLPGARVKEKQGVNANEYGISSIIRQK